MPDIRDEDALDSRPTGATAILPTSNRTWERKLMCRTCPANEAMADEARIDPVEVLPHANERASRDLEDKSFHTTFLPALHGLRPAIQTGFSETPHTANCAEVCMLRSKGMDAEPAEPTLAQDDGVSLVTVTPVRACLPSHGVLWIRRGAPHPWAGGETTRQARPTHAHGRDPYTVHNTCGTAYLS